ncbi:hypothetical protein K488DRAFT_55014 [Vararia minispora EC-137]|uniref:Uncharacterized protein n=1 Tax=Vararia minispora EC-137 TaxID=1314806 RepID=A0ACB8QEC4_9AGAM|nr:hypothetical protein K488DRAFT_55014 [Vararia minispora EC-137]
MTPNDLKVLDTLGTAEYFKDDLSDDEMDIPAHMVPPNPDDSEILPSQVHPSYPYGNPTNLKHPAAHPRVPYDPTSRALFEDMGYAGGGVNGALRWRDLALDILLPVDREREEAARAAQARKMATGAAAAQQQQQQQAVPPLPMPPEMGQADTTAETVEEENDENEDEDEEMDEDDEDGEGDDGDDT